MVQQHGQGDKDSFHGVVTTRKAAAELDRGSRWRQQETDDGI